MEGEKKVKVERWFDLGIRTVKGGWLGLRFRLSWIGLGRIIDRWRIVGLDNQ